MIPFHLTASALRSIDKAGGLDNYLLTSKHVSEGEGLAVKQTILRRLANAKKKGTEILGKIVLHAHRSEGDTDSAATKNVLDEASDVHKAKV
jgi:hypothetical protein